MRWLIDGNNVIGSRPDGWWRERAGAMRRLVSNLEAWAATHADPVTVVFDGPPRDIPDAGGRIEVVFAPGGRNAADDEIVRRVAADPDPSSLVVVTSDRELRERVRSAGAQAAPARGFREKIEA